MFWALLVSSLVSSAELPMGAAPASLEALHFPDRIHAFVWRNWQLVPADRMAEVVGAQPEQILEVGRSMGLSGPPEITEDQRRRSYISVIRRNWHLLPYEQLLSLLGWTPEEMAFCLREDDFLYIKLGNLKPKCEPLTYQPPGKEEKARAAEIARIVRRSFPEGMGTTEEPLFGFVQNLSSAPSSVPSNRVESRFSPRYCYSYFALYGDPLLDKELDPFPDGYLARLAASGVNGVWLQAVLFKLAPFPWEPSLSADYEVRLERLRELVARAKKHGIGIYLYLNEPRSMPLSFFEKHPGLKGVVEGEYAAICTSVPEVKEYLRDSVTSICKEVPDLAGFFTITASENLTNCWSHHQGANCPHCASRGPAEVIAEVNALIRQGINLSESKAELVAWDWGWADSWAEDAVENLPRDVALMSVSEWSIPIQRGGIDSVVGEYSLSTIGPGPRATRHWGFAQKRHMKTLAKIQANNTWELSAVPYIPVLENVATHAANLRSAHVDGLMMSWTLGGCPSPNLEVVAEIGSPENPSVEEAMTSVAERRFGSALAPAAIKAWRAFSAAFKEFPYHGGTVYNAPMQMGPANLLWGEPTGYRSTMVGFPYDDLTSWRTVYPADVFAGQFEKMADGFDASVKALRFTGKTVAASPDQTEAFAEEADIAEACAMHFRSVANQSRFVVARDALAGASSTEQASALIGELQEILDNEIDLAVRLHAIQSRDSRIGFEATNHYFYVPVDLGEKVIGCNDLLERWLPEERAKHRL